MYLLHSIKGSPPLTTAFPSLQLAQHLFIRTRLGGLSHPGGIPSGPFLLVTIVAPVNSFQVIYTTPTQLDGWIRLDSLQNQGHIYLVALLFLEVTRLW